VLKRYCGEVYLPSCLDILCNAGENFGLCSPLPVLWIIPMSQCLWLRFVWWSADDTSSIYWIWIICKRVFEMVTCCDADSGGQPDVEHTVGKNILHEFDRPSSLSSQYYSFGSLFSL